MPWLSKQPLIYRLFSAVNVLPDIIFGEMRATMSCMLRIVVKIPQFVKILCQKIDFLHLKVYDGIWLLI